MATFATYFSDIENFIVVDKNSYFEQQHIHEWMSFCNKYQRMLDINSEVWTFSQNERRDNEFFKILKYLPFVLKIG